MTAQWEADQRRLLNLLADDAAFGLSEVESAELTQLMESHPDFDTECMERATATVQLAFATVECMPDAIRSRISARGVRYVGAPSRAEKIDPQ